MSEQPEQPTSNPQSLLSRCADVIAETIDDLRNDRAGYEGYAKRQARFDALIAEREALLAEVRATDGDYT